MLLHSNSRIYIVFLLRTSVWSLPWSNRIKSDVTFLTVFNFFVKAFFTYSLFSFFLSLPAYSQLLVGPEIGVNYSWTSLRDDDLNDRFKMKAIPGFHAGGRVAFKVRNRFFLHASLLYSTKGRTLTGKMDPLLKSTATYSYIDMWKVKCPALSIIRFNFRSNLMG